MTGLMNNPVGWGTRGEGMWKGDEKGLMERDTREKKKGVHDEGTADSVILMPDE